MIGIVSYGGYIPRMRLNRMAVMKSMGWFAPGLMGLAKGERSMCNWDEDSMTMGVAASQDCLAGLDKKPIDALYMASTTFPFSDRQNAGILKAALNLKDEILSADFSSSLRSGTTALITAMEAVTGGEKGKVLVTATDQRRSKSASSQEMWFGDGAASLLIGRDNVIAEYLGSHSLSTDFVDHYRGAEVPFDYNWEERWIRDEGYFKIYPQAIGALLKKAGMPIGNITQMIYPCVIPNAHGMIGKRLGGTPDQIAPNLYEQCGECGTAHPLIMLVSALEKASPGDILLVAGYGQGADVILFKVTENIKELSPREGISFCLARKKVEDTYTKLLQYSELIKTEMGARAEKDNRTALSILWRERKLILGFIGGRCAACGTPQIPMERVCVNPKCGAVDSQEEYEFADQPAKILTFTGDNLTASLDPPAIYGLIQFDRGGRMIMDFTDCSLAEVEVGVPMKVSFRKKYYDKDRGFTGYFWKAVPVRGAKG
jgi:3-hydroxy-3-methylglutaryl CoA synthase